MTHDTKNPYYASGFGVFKRPTERSDGTMTMGCLICEANENIEDAAQTIADALNCHNEMLNNH